MDGIKMLCVHNAQSKYYYSFILYSFYYFCILLLVYLYFNLSSIETRGLFHVYRTLIVFLLLLNGFEYFHFTAARANPDNSQETEQNPPPQKKKI